MQSRHSLFKGDIHTNKKRRPRSRSTRPRCRPWAEINFFHYNPNHHRRFRWDVSPDELSRTVKCQASVLIRIVTANEFQIGAEMDFCFASLWLGPTSFRSSTLPGIAQVTTEDLDEMRFFLLPAQMSRTVKLLLPIICLVPSRSSSIRDSRALALRTRAQLSRVALQEPGKKRLWRRQTHNGGDRITDHGRSGNGLLSLLFDWTRNLLGLNSIRG